jgi:hypothetical protein
VVVRNKASQEVVLTVSFDDFYEVIVQLFALLGLPVRISLINRNHKVLIGSLHAFNKFAFCPLHSE